MSDTEIVEAFCNFLSWGVGPARIGRFEAKPVPPAWFAYVMGATKWCPPKGEL